MANWKMSVLGAAVGALLLASAGCGDDGPAAALSTNGASGALTAVQAVDDTSIVEFADRVFRFDSALPRAAHLEPGRLELPADDVAGVQHLEVDDVLQVPGATNKWHKIRAIDSSADTWVFELRPARLTEIIENARLRGTVHPTTEPAAQAMADNAPSETRRQAAQPPGFDESASGAPDLTGDFSGLSQLEVDGDELGVDILTGELDFTPAVAYALDIENGQIVGERFRASGTALFESNWEVRVDSTGVSERKSVRVGSVDDEWLFNIFGQMMHVEPRLLVSYDVYASGQGTVEFGMAGQGFVGAGYDCTADGGCQAFTPSSPRPSFEADSSYQWREGRPQARLRAEVTGELVLEDVASTRGRLVPLQLRHASDTMMAPPFCPIETWSRLSAYAEPAVNSGRLQNAERSLFDEEAMLTSEDGCGMGPATPTTCTSDSECPSEEVCLAGANTCVPAGEMEMTLRWESPVNLNLEVETDDGEVLSTDNPQTTQNDGTMHLTSVGTGGCTDCVGECTGEWTLNCANEQPSNGSCPDGCNYNRIDAGSCSGQTTKSCEDLPGNQSCNNPQCRQTHACFEEHTDDVGGPGNEGQEEQVTDLCLCAGTYQASCAGYSQSTCNENNGCEWNTDIRESCSGSVSLSCDDMSEAACKQHNECNWETIEQPATASLPPYFEHAAFNDVSISDPFRVRVVNVSGVEESEPVDEIGYDLSFRTATGEAFGLSGVLETTAGSTSVGFNYEYGADTTTTNP